MAATADRPLAPRIELFCRAAARGQSLAEAARRAGYAPGAARQRGSELWARDDVQARISELSVAEAARREELVGWLRQQHDALYAKLVEQERFAVAARVLMHRWRFEKEVGAVAAQTEAARERLHEELREEVRAELRGELHGEVRAGLVAELRRDLVEGLGRELRAEMRAELRAKAKAAAAAPVVAPTVTNHDVFAQFAAPAPAAPLAVAAARNAGSMKALLRDLPLPVSAGALAKTG